MISIQHKIKDSLTIRKHLLCKEVGCNAETDKNQNSNYNANDCQSSIPIGVW